MCGLQFTKTLKTGMTIDNVMWSPVSTTRCTHPHQLIDAACRDPFCVLQSQHDVLHVVYAINKGGVFASIVWNHDRHTRCNKRNSSSASTSAGASSS